MPAHLRTQAVIKRGGAGAFAVFPVLISFATRAYTGCMNLRFAVAAICFSSISAFAQGFEASVSGGESRFGSTADIGNSTDVSTDPQYSIHGSFQLAFRMTLNPYCFFGHEFGYAYNHSSLNVPPITTTTGLAGQSVSQPFAETVSIHQGFYDFWPM